MKCKPFSLEDDEYLRAHYCEKTRRELARKLNRAKGSVSGRLRRLGLFLPEDIRQKRAVLSQYSPGNIPFNRGRRGIHHSPATEFKNGNVPHNTKHDGCIVTRRHNRTGISYKYVRVASGKWELLHRHNWKKTYGEIPPRHIVGFKDGDTLNCDLTNLYLMSCAENAKRNMNRVKQAKTMRKVWRQGRHFESDHYVAAALAQRDKDLRVEILKRPDLIEMKRTQLKLRRALREVDSQGIAG